MLIKKLAKNHKQTKQKQNTQKKPKYPKLKPITQKPPKNKTQKKYGRIVSMLYEGSHQPTACLSSPMFLCNLLFIVGSLYPK